MMDINWMMDPMDENIDTKFKLCTRINFADKFTL